MIMHPLARTTPLSRQEIVDLVEAGNRSPSLPGGSELAERPSNVCMLSRLLHGSELT